jgi:hypothetical protein
MELLRSREGIANTIDSRDDYVGWLCFVLGAGINDASK